MTVTSDQLPAILARHKLWAQGDPKGQRADLRGADLRGDYLRGSYLQRADLRGADLRGADLQRADLRGAYLQGADLRGADLHGADLQGADLRGADLQGADLRGAYLQRADLQGADLQGADLQRTKNATLVIAQTRILPAGSLIGWKLCDGGCIVKLRIPEEAKRSHAFGRKCRAEYAEVLAIYGEKDAPCKTAISNHDGGFTYEVGATVRPVNPFDDNWQEECTSGIHFFITREEAEAYNA